ncbi:uncharacterized protein C16orf96 isoform X3 [Sparus aurata]|uniref:uncharacterized protein C16orf96 isoform X3 n=2 Tax=Sparus aurata TaxID=8175 RepID=UPI0011C1661C|nr:uncharacterized protein C16orf96-like isoform X3 [Sparus aurata]
MSEQNISLYDLVNLSIGTPQKGAVNFAALHALLHAVLRQLDIREIKTRWRGATPGEWQPGAVVGVTASEQDHDTEEEDVQRDPVEREVRPGTELQERGASSSFPTPSAGPGVGGHEGLRSRIESCEDEVSKLLSAFVEVRGQRSDGWSQIPETFLRSLRQNKAMKLIQELNEQKDDLKEEMKELHQQHKTVGAETLTAVETCCHRVDDLEETVRSLKETFQKYPEPEELIQCVTWDDMQAALLGDTESTHKECVHSGLIAVRPTHTPFSSTFTVNTAASRTSSPSSSHPVQDTDRSATPPSPAISRQISTLQQATDTQPGGEASPQLTRPQTGRLSAGVFQSLKAGGSERYPEMMSALRNIGKQRDTFNKLEARVAALEEAKVEQSELTHIRELITHKGSQEVSSNLMDQLNQQRALIKNLMSERDKNVELVDDVQKAILQLQAECEKLHESSRSLQEDSRQRHTHIEELYKKTEELEEKKADKRVVEREIKADKSALESKVSRLQFDSVTEQLNAMFHELLHKVTGQEQDWHKVIDRLSTEMECKLNRIELDSVKKQLEGRWRNIHEKLQAQEAPEHEDAAALRKQLVGRFHCLSCDRPVVKYTSGTHLVKLPSSSGFPAHKSNRPFTVYALERFRQHYRSERISERTDYSQLTVSRSCGGRHTVTSASQRRTGLHKHHTQTEVDTMIQSEEVDIIGMDGHIYKGRLNTPAVRNTDSKLPTISAKEGLSKDKKSSMSHKPSASPEVGHTAQLHHTHSAKSAQCSRSASSSSGRDWPVSALGCTSQSSITPASATAESNAGRQANEPLDL